MGRYDLDTTTVIDMLKELFEAETGEGVLLGCCCSLDTQIKIEAIREVVGYGSKERQENYGFQKEEYES